MEEGTGKARHKRSIKHGENGERDGRRGKMRKKVVLQAAYILNLESIITHSIHMRREESFVARGQQRQKEQETFHESFPFHFSHLVFHHQKVVRERGDTQTHTHTLIVTHREVHTHTHARACAHANIMH